MTTTNEKPAKNPEHEAKREAARKAAELRKAATLLRSALREKLAAARAHAQKIANTATAAENYAATEAVTKLQRELADQITDGALPCPLCGKPPVGLEHPLARGSTFEIGCATPTCVPFEHEDGTKREVRARGGSSPSHAVDSWNEGPDGWCLYVDKATTVPAVQAAQAPEEIV